MQRAHYSLRSNLPNANIILQRTARQWVKDDEASYITRVSKISRGLHNRWNDCFRNSTLQALMHSLRFLKYISMHNKPLRDGTTVIRVITVKATGWHQYAGQNGRMR